MFTSWDKALVAAIMSIISLAVLWFGYEGYFATLREEQWMAILAILTPVFVFLVPNKQVPTPPVASTVLRP